MSFEWRFFDCCLQRRQIPLLMGILNVTPDSFSDGGLHTDVEKAVAHGLQLAAAGADIIDVGGESTRPGAAPVPVDVELRRTIPVIEELAQRINIPISIDTTKSEVARRAVAAGAKIVNDISGGTFDDDMLPVCAESRAGICLMHIQGTPQTMQQDPVYSDVVADVTDFLRQRLEAFAAAKIAAERICVDPGIGFGKTADHNLQLMRAVSTMRNELQRPVLIGHSRKRFLSRLLGRSVEERLSGTLGVAIALAEAGTDVLRVHDVQAVRDALLAWRAVSNPDALPQDSSVGGTE
ncbi:MAG: dihydropteroate synthase [Planctomycetaceae bacterium]